MVDQNERNRLLAEEFRARGGWVDEPYFRNATLLLLTNVGRKSGKTYVTPMVYLADGDNYVVFATHQGSDIHPDWALNVLAAHKATIEVGTEKFDVIVRATEGEEREDLWRRQIEAHPTFADYRKKTTRDIPVISLSRA